MFERGSDITITSPSCSQEPTLPAVTRAMQIDQKAKDHPAGGRGRGRGKGMGKGRGRGTMKKDDDEHNDDAGWDEWMKQDQLWDSNWRWAKDYGWYWEDKAAAAPAKAKSKKRAKDAVASAGSAEPNKKKARNEKDKKDEKTKSEKPCKKTTSPKSEPKQAAAPNARKEKKHSEPEDLQPKKRSRKAPKEESPHVEFTDAPTKSKDIKKEIYEFLLGAQDLTGENARAYLKSKVPNWPGLGVGMLLNIYWVSRGVKGVGVGVTSKKQRCDFAFFGYKSECDSWIYAIAAAIKSADILATSMHICSEMS